MAAWISGRELGRREMAREGKEREREREREREVVGGIVDSGG